MSRRPLRVQLERWIRQLRVHRCESPFVVLFRERSGSTYLCTLLDLHPEISCRLENFHGVYVGKQDTVEQHKDLKNWERRLQKFDGQFLQLPTSKQVVTHFHDIFSFKSKACGFKFKFPRQTILYPEVIEELELMGPQLRIILLLRRNLLKQAISRQNLDRIQSATGDSNLSAGETTRPASLGPLELDVAKAMGYMRFSITEQSRFKEWVETLQRNVAAQLHELDYEDLLFSRNQTLHRVFEFLNVDPGVEIDTVDIRKATSNDLSNAVKNYDELVEQVRGTEFEDMLHSSD